VRYLKLLRIANQVEVLLVPSIVGSKILAISNKAADDEITTYKVIFTAPTR
jgi:hypothetical protein